MASVYAWKSGVHAGSVAAREYSIPTVVGVNQATIRLQIGQLVRVDGSSGTAEILDGKKIRNLSYYGMCVGSDVGTRGWHP